MDLKILCFLLPVLFMIHDFEEIIFFKKWIKSNKPHLTRRFPNLALKLLPHLENLSTAAFCLAVAEEFILVSAVSLHAAYSENYLIWYGAFIGFSVHLLIHIIQWVIYRRYIPCIVTSVLILPYSIYTFNKINQWGIFNRHEQLTSGIIGLIIVIVNLVLIHKFIIYFDKWLKK